MFYLGFIILIVLFWAVGVLIAWPFYMGVRNRRDKPKEPNKDLIELVLIVLEGEGMTISRAVEILKQPYSVVSQMFRDYMNGVSSEDNIKRNYEPATHCCAEEGHYHISEEDRLRINRAFEAMERLRGQKTTHAACNRDNKPERIPSPIVRSGYTPPEEEEQG